MASEHAVDSAARLLVVNVCSKNDMRDGDGVAKNGRRRCSFFLNALGSLHATPLLVVRFRKINAVLLVPDGLFIPNFGLTSLGEAV